MKLLHVKADNFKNCEQGFEIDFVALSKKTAEDKEYELQEIADDLFTYNTIAVVGKNASGKTSAMDLLDICYSILGGFRLKKKAYDCNNVNLLMDFYENGYIYRYETTLISGEGPSRGSVLFTNQKIRRKKYFKSKLKTIYSDDDFVDFSIDSALPEDISQVFFVLKDLKTRAIYVDSFGVGPDTYDLTFTSLKAFGFNANLLLKILNIFDENIKALNMIDEHSFKVVYSGNEYVLSDKELIYFLSSGTTKGMLTYVLCAASLLNGFDLIIDEIENHFHKTLVENLISLYKDKNVNKHNATLIFTTHYCELLDLFNRQDNILITKADDKVTISNMYKDFSVRSELLKSKQFYNNVFKTAVNYNALMEFKKELRG